MFETSLASARFSLRRQLRHNAENSVDAVSEIARRLPEDDVRE